jgi:hypothetical protein
MPNYPTFPILFDNVCQLNITRLKHWGYLNPGQKIKGVLTWSLHNNTTCSISIVVNNQSTNPYIELDYHFANEHRKYRIQIVSMSSNLNRGAISYFLCPVTKKRCRILYLVRGYFLHREAFEGCMYASQTKSKSWRQLIKPFDKLFQKEQAYETIYSKHFKSHYAGKPTKRCLRIVEKLKMP